jgi:hypothetical protein
VKTVMNLRVHKRRGIFLLAEWLLASQQGLFSTQTVLCANCTLHCSCTCSFIVSKLSHKVESLVLQWVRIYFTCIH